MQRLIGQLLIFLLLMTPVIGQALPCPMPVAQAAAAADQPPCHDAAGQHATDPTSGTHDGGEAFAHAGMDLADCLSTLAPPARTDLKAAAATSPAPDTASPWMAADLPATLAVLARAPSHPPPAHPALPASRLWADSQRLLL